MHDLKHIDLYKACRYSLGEPKKDWGREVWLLNQPNYCLKLLDLDAGFRCSKHRHKIKTESFLILEGQMYLETWDPKFPDTYAVREMTEGHKAHIEAGTFHRFSSKVGALILETSTHHRDDDVERAEPSGPIP